MLKLRYTINEEEMLDLQRNLPKVSIIVPTFNSDKTIRACILSILTQCYPKHLLEVIVIDEGSTDATLKIVKDFRGIKVHVVRGGRSLARNLGAIKSKGKYLLFVDSDMILSRNLINTCVIKMETDKNLVGLNITERIYSNNKLWMYLRDFERSFYSNTLVDAARFIKKEAFFSCGGFNNLLQAGEDWDFHLRLSKIGKVDFISEEHFTHIEFFKGITAYARKKLTYIRILISQFKRDPKLREKLNEQLKPLYRVLLFTSNGNWKRFLRKPGYAFLILLIKTMLGLLFVLSRYTMNGRSKATYDY